MVDMELAAQAVTVALGIGTIYFGTQFKQARGLLKELNEALNVTERYLQTPVVSQEQLQE